MAKGEIEALDYKKKAITIDGNKYFIRKLWDTENFGDKLKVGTIINYKKKGPNIDFKGIISGGLGDIFDYPYNFVKSKEKVKREPIEKGKVSGSITGKIKNRTPIFISGKKKERNGHVSEYFMKEGKNYIIPASTIKGTIRSALEAISNSCYSNIMDERLEERKSAGSFNDKRFGIVTKLPDGDTDGIIKEAEVIRVFNNKKTREYAIPRKYRRPGVYHLTFDDDILNYRTGDNISSQNEFNKLLNNNGDDAVDVKLWVSSDIFNKKREKLMFTTEKNNEYSLSMKEYKDINYIIKQRQEREEKEGNNFYFKKLEVGTPIIFQDKGTNAFNLAFSEIPRLRYDLSYYDLLKDDKKACTKRDNLCYACRIFGMTGNTNETQDTKGEKESLQSKVFFSDAKIPKKEALFIPGDNVTIKPLGSPQPTLTSFYLEKGDYNSSKSRIRGRKFYWHHTDKIDKRFNQIKGSIKDKNQEKYNSTIELMETGNKFKFDIRFENLTKKELGLLLYSIELDDGMLHKLGRGKALGLGTIEIEIDKFILDDPISKYIEFSNKNREDVPKEEYIKTFKNDLNYDKSSQKKQLDKILNKDNSLDFSKSAFPEEKGRLPGVTTVNWFMNQKEKGEYPKDFKLPNITDYR